MRIKIINSDALLVYCFGCKITAKWQNVSQLAVKYY